LSRNKNNENQQTNNHHDEYNGKNMRISEFLDYWRYRPKKVKNNMKINALTISKYLWKINGNNFE
jgi:hypothetical protein